MEKRYQVFISSTYNDLQDERAKVFQTLMQLDCIPAGMELFPAADEEQWNFIKRVINDCDYYLLIIGGRYGTVTQEGVSFTEKEYDYAVEQGLKVIALIHGEPDQIATGKTDKSASAAKKLAKFREKVSTGRLVQFWKQPSDLPGKVALSVSMTMKLYPAIGWVRASAVASNEALADLNELRKRNSELEEQLAKVRAKEKQEVFAGRTYEEICALLKEEKVTLLIGAEMKETEVDALAATIACADVLVRGASNSSLAHKVERGMFYGLASRLAVYGLADFVATPRNVQWQRIALTEAGKRFVATAKAATVERKTAGKVTTGPVSAAIQSNSQALAGATPLPSTDGEHVPQAPAKRIAMKKARPSKRWLR